MQFLFLLFPCTHAVLARFASSVLPDISSREFSMTDYTVVPIDPANTVQTTKTEIALKELCGDENVTPIRYGSGEEIDKIDSWMVTSQEVNEVRKTLGAVAGVLFVKHSDPPKPPPESIDRHRMARRDDLKIYTVSTNTTNVQELEEFLKSKVQGNTKFYQKTLAGKLLGWYNLVLTTEGAEAIKAHKDIKGIRVEGRLEPFRALPSPEESRSLISRDGGWEKQAGADKALNMDSQFSGADLNRLTDFVHVPEPGKDTFVYLLERGGAQLDVMNTQFAYEFRPPGDDPKNMKVMKVPRYEDKGTNDWDDSAPDHHRQEEYKRSHGTKAAAKAVGSQFGVAKSTGGAFRQDEDDDGSALESDFGVGIELIRAHIAENAGRELMSVVLVVSGVSGITLQEAKTDPNLQDTFEKPMLALLELGVPIVLASGNVKEGEITSVINSLPQLLQQKELLPVINVGNAKYDGRRWEGSRYFASDIDEQLIYAPGTEVDTLSKDGFRAVPATGTSFAAPQVAGLIATYLGHEPTRHRWDGLTGLERVIAIRKYLFSDDSSWVRNTEPDDSGKPIRMIWNGAGLEDHRSSGANGYHSNPAPSAAPAPAPPPAAPKGQALSIILQKRRNVISYASQWSREIINIDWSWRFFPTDQGVAKLCNLKALSHDEPWGNDPEPELTKEQPNFKNKRPPYPHGDFAIQNLHGRDCRYKNDGTGNPGMLWCMENGQEVGISCHADPMKDRDHMSEECKDKDVLRKGERVFQHGIVACEW